MSGQAVTVPPWQQTPAKGFLSVAQLAQLSRVMDRLLPEDTDRQVPGAKQAGAAQYISLLLSKDAATYYEIPDWQRLYPQWLEALEVWSQSTYGGTLSTLDDTKIDGVISALEQGTLTNTTLSAADQKTCFKTMWRHMLQGCFGDPRWGGNKDKVMWRAIGYLQTPETAQQLKNDKLPTIPL